MQLTASIILLLALVPVLTTPIINDQNNDLASMSLPRVTMPKHGTVNWDALQADFAVMLPEQAIEAMPEQPEAVETEAVTDVEEPVEDFLASASGTGRYYLIISSLSNEKQVKEYLGSHHDMDGKMKVLKRRNKFCIYVARDNSADKLYKIKSSLPERYHDAWVCD